MTPDQEATMPECHANLEGDCFWDACPQLRDGEPLATGRHCPIDNWKEDSEW